MVPFLWEINMKGHDLPSQALRLDDGEHNPSDHQILNLPRLFGWNKVPVTLPQIIRRLARNLDAPDGIDLPF